MTAVIYARYSSDNQREESIEGQIRECTAYAEKNGITVVKHYIDRALSAKTDNRPDFQQMIKDSEKRLFDIVLVWKLDRFARNRYDSAHYEYQLERNHVKLVSATEPISDSPAGIMVKSMLTGMAEYYSAELSEKVVRGMTENVLKGKYNGGTIPIGFKVDEEKFFQVDPLKAPFVVEAFQRYNDGATMKELMNWLNDSGVTTNRNQKFTYNSVQTLLTNKRYIGENHFKDIVMPDSIPAIVDKDLFEEVQQKIKKNSRAPARHKAEDDYLLTTKLFCGMCGAMMFGECGTGRNKIVHHYYKCATAKRFKTCKKKTVRKEWLEDLVIAETMKLIQDDAVIDAIVAEVMELQEQENTTLPLLEKQMREVENGIENMLNAIQAGVLTNSTKSRLEKLEAQQKELEVRIAEEKIARPRLSENQVRFWLTRFRKLDPNVKSHRETLINTFVNAVYLYDEKVLIAFNYKDGTKTISFNEIAAKDASEGNGSDLGCFAPPRTPVSNGYRSFCFTCLEKGAARVDSNSCGAVAEDSAKTAQWAVFSSAARAIHTRPPRTPVSEPGTGVSVLSVLQKGLQGWIRTASTRRIVRRGKAPVQQRRPLPAAETGRSCWGCGQQDARAAQGTMQPLGAATRVPFLRGSRHLPAHILHLSLTCDTIQVTETTQTEDFFYDLRYPEQPAQLSGRKRQSGHRDRVHHGAGYHHPACRAHPHRWGQGGGHREHRHAPDLRQGTVPAARQSHYAGD
ncbi:resolvase, N-terminal domain protein [Faecalibacterium prausnitzii M21/2]|jgi:DNA invertase Pin-like site-specific DNA recombinase|uniref:Resolvase, N-terminal domain protein n=9 Tax=Faecalibacterium TaxID=216851 RepID=A8SAG8_9FIRM|nr:resolvase, N-terminal domain protein [Faecalibacterium prausnitzii M21/2]